MLRETYKGGFLAMTQNAKNSNGECREKRLQLGVPAGSWKRRSEEQTAEKSRRSDRLELKRNMET